MAQQPKPEAPAAAGAAAAPAPGGGPGPPGSRWDKGNNELPFDKVAVFLSACERAPTTGLKSRYLAEFRQKYVNRRADDLFDLYRLLAPTVRARGAPSGQQSRGDLGAALAARDRTGYAGPGGHGPRG
jgi:hypothetical protein